MKALKQILPSNLRFFSENSPDRPEVNSYVFLTNRIED